MEALTQQRPNYVLLKIDVKSWKSPVALQYSIRQLPFLKIYDPSGRLVAEGDGAYQYLSR